MKARLLIPLFVGDHIVGTLNFNSRKTGIYSLDVVEELGSIPDQLGLAIEKYKMYTRLQGSEEKYRFLFEQGPPAATVDRTGRFIDVNEGCLRLFGTRARSSWPCRPGTWSPRPRRGLHADVFGTGRPRRRRSCAAARTVLSSGMAQRLPGLREPGAGQLVDITPRKSAEEALRREKDFTSRVLSVANALIVALDAEGRVLLFQPEVRGGDRVVGGRDPRPPPLGRSHPRRAPSPRSRTSSPASRRRTSRLLREPLENPGREGEAHSSGTTRWPGTSKGGSSGSSTRGSTSPSSGSSRTGCGTPRR